MQTTRFLITGVGGQGTILASDVLAEVGLRLGYDAKKSDILGLAVRGGSVVSHIIWGGKVRAPMIDEGSADYYISFEWLEGLRRMAYTNPDRTVPFISPILFRSFINRFLPFPARCGRWSRTALWNALPTLPTAARRWCVSRPRDTRPADSARLLLGTTFPVSWPGWSRNSWPRWKRCAAR